MQSIFLLIGLALSLQGLLAQNYIDFQQLRIDRLDGKEDFNFNGDPNSAVFFTTVDSLEKLIQTADIANQSQEQIRLGIYFELLRYDGHEPLSNSQVKSFHYLKEFLSSVQDHSPDNFLSSSPSKAYEILEFIYALPSTQYFLQQEVKQYPQKVLQHYQDFSQSSYALDILHEAVKRDPMAVKPYLGTYHVIYKQLKTSDEPLDSLVLYTYKLTGKASNALSLLASIESGEFNVEEADEIAKLSSEQYFTKLVELASNKNEIANFSVDRTLEQIALNKVRLLNSLYENHNNNLRFKSIHHYDAKQLYNLMVYSEDEIFTSTFNGMFALLMQKLISEETTSYELLQSVNFNRFRTFLKMNISFGKLDDFLAEMTSEQHEELIHRFMDITCENNKLKEAVSIADAISSLEDSVSLFHMEKDLVKYYDLSVDKETRLIYALLMKLYENKSQLHPETFKQHTAELNIPSIQLINSHALFGNDEIHTQVHCFYDDEDGVLSYKTFMQLWKGNQWTITDYEEFVQIKSSNDTQRIQILANKPQFDSKGQALIAQFLDAMHADIEVLVHRGHSFYVPRSLNFLEAPTKIVLLGSCGGYHQVSEILNRSPEAHIISTKQIGTYTVNNPLIYQLVEEVDTASIIYWEKFWKKLGDEFEPDTYGFQKFQEYVPPHQNLGAAFIQAYRQNIYKQ